MQERLRTKIHVKKGDFVKIIAGNDKGKIGKVLKVMRKKQKIIVEKINIKTKHMQNKQNIDIGQIIKFEAPIHSSNVMLYSQNTQVASRYNYIKLDNKKHRILKKNKEVIN